MLFILPRCLNSNSKVLQGGFCACSCLYSFFAIMGKTSYQCLRHEPFQSLTTFQPSITINSIHVSIHSVSKKLQKTTPGLGFSSSPGQTREGNQEENAIRCPTSEVLSHCSFSTIKAGLLSQRSQKYQGQQRWRHHRISQFLAMALQSLAGTASPS